MKKILFNDKFGLTDLVLSGQKTMTRRMMPQQPKFDDCRFEWGIDDKGKTHFAMYRGDIWLCDVYPAYQIGEEVAVAQAYMNDDVLTFNAAKDDGYKRHKEMLASKGYRNKMFTKAEYMPHRIQITDIKAERLNDISEEDCRKEGIICVTWRQWLLQDFNDFSPQKHVDHDVWTLPIFRKGIENGWEEQSKDDIAAYDAKTAFIVLFAKLAHKQLGDVYALNPWVFGYEFRLIK